MLWGGKYKHIYIIAYVNGSLGDRVGNGLK